MHLKNFSLITQRNGRVDLAPAYDFLNSTIALQNAQEELALPLRGKRSGLTKDDFFEYFAGERLEINGRVRAEIIAGFKNAFPVWYDMVAKRFLSAAHRSAYADNFSRRRLILGIA